MTKWIRADEGFVRTLRTVKTSLKDQINVDISDRDATRLIDQIVKGNGRPIIYYIDRTRKKKRVSLRFEELGVFE